jgi:hypothetical protein
MASDSAAERCAGTELRHQHFGREEFTDMPVGAAQLAALLGAHLDDVSGARDGTLVLSFATGSQVVIFDDSTHYESYQMHDGDRLIVV